MGVPQLENGYTRIAHELLEVIYSSGLTGREIRFLLLLIRRTYGYNQKACKIGRKEFDILGINGSNFFRVRDRLVRMGIIHYFKGSYQVNKYYCEWGCGKAVEKLWKSCGKAVNILWITQKGSVKKGSKIVSKRGVTIY